MGELGASYRRDHVMVISGRVHAARDRSPELTRYREEFDSTRSGPSQDPKKKKKKKKWAGLSDPEMKRKKRIVKYKVYAVEGKVKASLRKGLRWIKNKVSEFVHGC